MQLPVKVNARVVVQPGSSVLPESDSPALLELYQYTVRGVNVCWYDAVELSLLDLPTVSTR